MDAAAASPRDAEVWYQLGLVYKSSGQTEAAEACLRQSLSLKRTEPILRFEYLTMKL